MMSSILVTVTAIAAALQAPQTSGTFPDARQLDIIANYGTVLIEAWPRSDLEVTATHSDQVRVEIKGGPTVEVREHRSPRASLERIDYQIRVPVDTVIMLWSDSADVTIRGVKGRIEVHGQHGAVEVSDVDGAQLNSTTGNLVVRNATGRVTLDSTAGSITAIQLSGDVIAESVGGGVQLGQLSGSSVRVTTIGGAIEVSGTPQVDGAYDIASQSGSVTLHLPDEISGRITYGTVRGTVRTDLPEDDAVRSDDGRVTIEIGSSGATIDIITFRGDITIRRGGGARRP
jgi:DUF4097 and DUF4098 domain-containing protein YvlB